MNDNNAGAPSSVIRVLISDDHPAIRRLLKEFLNDYDDIDIIGEAVTGTDAIKKAAELRPEVILMDVRLPDMDGMDAVAAILQHNPAIKIIAISAHSAEDVAARMKRAGAAAFISKNTNAAEIHSLICEVVGKEP